MLREIFDNLDRHCGKFDTYFDIYERHFGKFVGKKPVVVEVGICRGGSAEMWQKYFGEGSTIIGIDVDDNAFKPEHQTPGCKQVRGDQSSVEFWKEFFATHPDVDVFIDDGGHHQFQQVNTLNAVWPHIKQGGVYLTEDTHTSYWPEYSGGGLKKPTAFLEYAKTVSDAINSDHWRPEDRSQNNMILADHFKELRSMHFYDSIVVFEKEPKITATLLTSTPI
jgi:23S rRNA U2552 (ribose-2'-O)-methylase RlmE/FtsJ